MQDKQILIRNLLNQAEGAGTPEEATAFRQAAEKLSVQYRIDLDVARAAMTEKERSMTLVCERVVVGAGKSGERGLRQKTSRYADIAAVYGNRCDLAHSGTSITIYGNQKQVDLAKTVLLDLEIQFAEELAAESRRVAKIRNERFSKVDFTSGFWTKVYYRISTEMQEAQQQAEAAEKAKVKESSTDESTASTGVALAIRAREKEVNDFYKANSRAKGFFKSGSANYGSTSYSNGLDSGANAVIRSKQNLGRKRELA